MTTCQHIMDLLDCFLPFDCVSAKDNAGLIVGDSSWPCRRILAAVDLTEAVIEEAVQKDCQMILTHHHIMGKGVKKINPSSFEGRAVMKLVEHKICFVACHNNLDFLNEGTADALLLAAGCSESGPMYDGYAALATTPAETMADHIPVPDRPNIVPGLVAGFGRVGDLDVPCTFRELINRFRGGVTGPVNIVGSDDRMIYRATCQVGWGKHADIARTKAIGADVLITGDVCHDDRLYAAEIGVCLLDFCHHEAEKPGVLMMADNLQQFIQKDGCGVEILISDAPQPVRHEVMPDPFDLSRYHF